MGFPVGPLSCSRSNSTAAISVCRRQSSEVRVIGGTGDPGATAASSVAHVLDHVVGPHAFARPRRSWAPLVHRPVRRAAARCRCRGSTSARSWRQVVDICESRAGSSTRSTSVAAASIWPHIQSLITPAPLEERGEVVELVPGELGAGVAAGVVELEARRSGSRPSAADGWSRIGARVGRARQGQAKHSASGVPAFPESVRYRMRSRLPCDSPRWSGSRSRRRPGRGPAWRRRR